MRLDQKAPRIRLAAAALALALGASGAAAADERPAAKTGRASPLDQFAGAPVVTTRVSGDVYALEGPGGNITVLAARDGVVLVDSGVPGRADDIVKAVKALTDAPIRRVINTHWHFDHTGNNAALAASGAELVAHANVGKQMAVAHEIVGVKIPASPAAALPGVSYEGGLTIRQGGEEILLLHPPGAHTDGDTAVLFRRADVLSTGDLYSSDRYPFIDISVGGSIGGLIDAHDRLMAAAGERTRIVPGHGPVASRADLVAYRDTLATVRDRVASLVASGKTLEEVIASRPTRDVPPHFGRKFVSDDDFTRLVYMSLAGKRGAAAEGNR